MADNCDTYVLEEQIGFILRLASQRHSLIFQQNMIDQITPTQFSALIRMEENGECSQNHLGRLAGMDGATIKGVMDRLQQRGLTVSRADPQDKRRLLVSLSEKGRNLIADLKARGRKISAETLKPLSVQEQKTLLKILKKITGD